MEKDTISAEEMQDRLDLIEHKLKFVQQKPLVSVIEKLDPMQAGGNHLAGAIEKAGGELTSAPGQADVLLFFIPGKPLSALMTDVSIALHTDMLREVPAVKNNRVYLFDTDQVADKGKLELIESLAEIFQPKQFVFGYEGKLWLQFAV